MKDNHLLKDTVVCISDYSLSRTQMVFDSLDSICYGKTHLAGLYCKGI